MKFDIAISFDAVSGELKVQKSPEDMSPVIFLGVLERAKQSIHVIQARIEDKRDKGPRIHIPA